MVAGLGVISFEQAAMAEIGAGDAHDHNAVDDQRRARHRVAICGNHRLGRMHHPNLFACLGVQCDEPIVHKGANDHAFVDGGATIDDAATNDPQGFRRVVMQDSPDLLSRHGVHGRRRIVRRHVDDAVLDDGKPFPALQVGERIGPYRDQPRNVIFVDLGERAEPVRGIPHAIDKDVAGRLLVVLQIVGRLREHCKR